MESKIKKELTIEGIIENNKKYDEIKKITVMNDYYINVRPYVSNDDMNKIFSDFGEWIKDGNIKELITDKAIIKYFLCFVIKNQTDLLESINFKGDNVELFKIFEIILKCPAVDEIISSIDKKDLSLLYLKFNDIIKVSEKINQILNMKNKK